MVLHLFIATLLAFTAWLYPIKAVSSYTGDQQNQIAPKTQPLRASYNFPINRDKQIKQSYEPQRDIPPIQTAKPEQSSMAQSQTTAQQSSARASDGRSATNEEVKTLIVEYSKQYGIAPDLPLNIARCESGFNHLAKNKNSTASGVFQYLSSTWKSTDEGKAGLSVFDADANVRAAVKYIASRGHAQPWNASKHCWG